MYMFTICMPSLEQCLFRSFPLFKIVLLWFFVCLFFAIELNEFLVYSLNCSSNDEYEKDL